MPSRNPLLTGKPPFATDEPDSAYGERQPRRGQRKEPPVDPNARTSAYDVYDSYLDDTSNRNSGIGALGMGFMNGNMDDDDDDDDEKISMPATNFKDNSTRHPAPEAARNPPATARNPPAAARNPPVATRNPPAAARSPLSAAPYSSATARTPSATARAPPATARTPSATAHTPSATARNPSATARTPPTAARTPQAAANNPPAVTGNPQRSIPLAAPRPGYAAPIAALNLSQPVAVATPAGRTQAPHMKINVPPPNVYANSSRSPSAVPSTPHLLQPPVSPIVPAFTRPPKSPAPREGVKFATADPIMRGNSEDVLLPKRGEAGDDFWRRFSMVAKEEHKTGTRESSWLLKTQSRSARSSRLVAFVGIIIFLSIAGAIGLRLYLTHNQSPNQLPTAVGGSADESSASITSSSSATVLKSSSSPRVTPTNTVARRAEPIPTGRRLSPRHWGYPIEH